MSGPSQRFKFNSCFNIWLRIQIVNLLIYVFFLIIVLLSLSEVKTTPPLPSTLLLVTSEVIQNVAYFRKIQRVVTMSDVL